MQGKDVPINLRDAVPCFVAFHSSEVEGAMDICIRMCTIQPPAKWYQLIAIGLGFRGVGRTN